jgi:hypothetical protein
MSDSGLKGVFKYVMMEARNEGGVSIGIVIAQICRGAVVQTERDLCFAHMKSMLYRVPCSSQQ